MRRYADQQEPLCGTPRRVIFPCLHPEAAKKQPRKPTPTSPQKSDLSPTYVAEDVYQSTELRGSDALWERSSHMPVLGRSNSMDARRGMPTLPMPLLDANNEDPLKAIGDAEKIIGTNVRYSVVIQATRGRGQSSRRTSYPAISDPTVVRKQPCIAKGDPLPSILRRKRRLFGQTFPVTNPCPPLASPSSIRSLHVSDRGQETIGEIVGVMRINEAPSVMAKSGGVQKLRRNQSDTQPTSNARAIPSCVTRHQSLQSFSNKIKFDPHVTVYEYECTDYEQKGGDKWFTKDELASFKQEAIHRIRLLSFRALPTGTSRGSSIGVSCSFNHPALSSEDEGDTSATSHDDTLSQEIKNILVVDVHQVFLELFEKGIRHMLPHVSFSTARSADDAITKINSAKIAPSKGYDIIIVEERLRGSFSSIRHLLGDEKTPHTSTQAAGDNATQICDVSGSKLIQYILMDKGSETPHRRLPIIIGVSAHLDAGDGDKLRRSGADLLWPKPPPEMNSQLRSHLLDTLLKKRGVVDR